MIDSIPPHGAKPIQLLLVDDDDGDAKAVQRSFRKAKIANEMHRVTDGPAALVYLRNKAQIDPGTPCILLVDINMPMMSGHELISEIRRDPALHKLIVFMLTTSKDPADISAAYGNHVAGYVVKDRAGDDFLELTTMLERYWRVVEMPEVR
ncbi:MAG: response regulator [Pseudomonadota bacterium]